MCDARCPPRRGRRRPRCRGSRRFAWVCGGALPFSHTATGWLCAWWARGAVEAAAAAIREGQRRASCGKVTRRRRTLRARLPGAASMWTLLRSRTGRALSKTRPIRGGRGKASCLAPRWAWRCGRRGAFVRTNAWMCGCVGGAGGLCMLVIDCWCWCLWCVCARARTRVRACVRPSVRPSACMQICFILCNTYIHTCMHAGRSRRAGAC